MERHADGELPPEGKTESSSRMRKGVSQPAGALPRGF